MSALLRANVAGLAILALSLAALPAEARDTEHQFKIADVLADADYQQKIGNTLAFYFGDQPTPPIARNFGDFVTNKKTNAFGKPDEVACRWAMLSAMLQMREKARELGADAVVNVISFYKKASGSSRTDYECHAGNVVAGVALKGTFVKLGTGPATTVAAPAAGGAAMPAGGGDVAARLKQLQSLKDQGLINQREFDQRRKVIIEGL